MTLIEPAEIETRCAAIRLQKKELAFLAGRHLNTVVNLLHGRGSRADTLAAIGRVLVEEELRLRDYLVKRHPLAVEPGREEPGNPVDAGQRPQHRPVGADA